jgi:hypothetical protein
MAREALIFVETGEEVAGRIGAPAFEWCTGFCFMILNEIVTAFFGGTTPNQPSSPRGLWKP